MLERILQNTPATIAVTYYEDGGVVDPGAVTLTVSSADGTVLVDAETASGTGADARTYNLTVTETAQLDMLTASWESATKGTLTTTIEVVGGFLFSLAQARAISPLDDESAYPADKLIEYRTLAEQAFEDAAGVAFVPRYARQSFRSGQHSALVVKPRLRAYRSLTQDGTDLSPSELVDLHADPTGVIYPDSSSSWTGPVTVAYEHGYDSPPTPVSRAVLLLAKTWLIGSDSPIDMRATQLATEDGSINLATPGMFGSTFGIPLVDMTLEQYAIRSYVA